MEELKDVDAGAEKCEGTIIVLDEAETPASASDQPALTPTITAPVAASPIDLFETPMNADVPIISSGESDEITQELSVTETSNPNEFINSVAKPSNDADDLLLNFGGSFEGEGKVTNHNETRETNYITNQEEETDFLCFPPPVQTIPLQDIEDPFAPVNSELNLLGINGSDKPNNQEVRRNNFADEFLTADGDSKCDAEEDKSGSNFELDNTPNVASDTSFPKADNMVKQGNNEADHGKDENEFLSVSGASFPKADNMVEQGNNEADHGKDENEFSSVSGDAVLEEGVMPHSTAEEVGTGAPESPGEISPVIESQPPASLENKGQEEVLNQASNCENTRTDEIAKDFGSSSVEPSTDNNSVEAKHLYVDTTNDLQANDTGVVISQLTVGVTTPVTLSSVPMVAALNKEQVIVGGSVSDAQVNTDAEERTEEEEEWLSMGLGLGDALRQIVALTEDKDLSLALCREKDNGKTQAEALLVEVQTRLEAEMNRRAESDSERRKLRETLKSYEDRLKVYETMEDDLEKANANLVTVVTEKSKIEMEVQKLRDMVEDSQQKEAVLSNRLNEAKKKEANKSTAAGRLEEENEKLQFGLQTTKDELETVSKAKAKLESNMEKLKVKAVERVKQAETALSEERELNEERKKKMKTFVETKAEELREAKECASNMQKELEETRKSLRSSRDREEVSLKELEAARLKYRELQRDMERHVRNSEQLHKAGTSLEHELEKYASETEEHKKKRMSAKHEIMQMVRTLEAERAVSAKLRESVRFTFTPKALSQQELLTECLRDFESELERLAAKTGRALHPSIDSSETARDESTGGGTEASEINGSLQKSKKTRASKSDLDTERLISNLEQETQHVSKGIMALAGDIERMRSLLNDDNAFGCLAYFSTILPRREARHQRLGDGSDAHYERKNSTDRFV